MLTFLIIYLIGCALSFFRVRASFSQLSNTLGLELDRADWIIIFITSVVSWAGFLVGVFIYITANEKRFF